MGLESPFGLSFSAVKKKFKTCFLLWLFMY